MKLSKLVIYVLTLLFLSSCSEPTIEEDAKTAADLVNKSNQLALDNDVSGSGKSYAEAQSIIKKYRHTKEFTKFYELYSSFLEMNAFASEPSTKQADE